MFPGLNRLPSDGSWTSAASPSLSIRRGWGALPPSSALWSSRVMFAISSGPEANCFGFPACSDCFASPWLRSTLTYIRSYTVLQQLLLMFGTAFVTKSMGMAAFLPGLRPKTCKEALKGEAETLNHRNGWETQNPKRRCWLTQSLQRSCGMVEKPQTLKRRCWLTVSLQRSCCSQTPEHEEEMRQI